MKPIITTGEQFSRLLSYISLNPIRQTFAVNYIYKTYLIALICCFSFYVKAQVVPVGSGSYTTTFPGTDEAGRNTFPSGAPQLSGEAATKPVPTNDWWSNLVKVDHGGKTFNYPLSFRSETEGLVINYTIPLGSSPNEFREPMSDVDAIKVGVTGLSASKSTISDFSDWTVTANWNSGGNNFSALIGMGMPFVYFTKGAGNTARVEVNFNAPGVSISGNKLLIENNMNNANYVVFGPAGSTWSGSGGVFTSSLAGKDYWSMALVPPGMDINTFITNYEKYAYVFPEETSVDWNYNESTSTVTTTFTVTPNVKEGTSNEVLLGLLPHQWAHLGAGSPQPNLATYFTVRGDLKMLGGNSFVVENKFSGVLPTLPNLAKYSSGFDINSLYNKVDAIKGESLPAWTDSYNEGQNMNRLIQAARIADQIGHTAARDQLLNTVQERLEDWLTVEGGEVAFLFYYNDTWDALLGYPAGHSQDVNLNDHHFHWGYFIHAASALEQFRPGWANNWGPMINMLIRDAGNPSKTDNMFPFLRNFSPYSGHAWANGFATEPFGNDQESTSESMQFNASLIHWGTVTNNTEIRDLGIYLYTTEITAVQEYWFDVNDRTFQPEYAHEMVARIWGAGYDNGTWWTSDIAASYGIQLYPIHGGALYMGYDLDYVQEVWTGMTSKTEVLSNTPNPNLWYDTYWSFLAFLDPAKAIELYNAYPEREVKVGISDAQTYHWLHTMNAMGNVANEVTADYPIAAVFEKNGERTYVAHNYGSSPITVHFSDGTSLAVPAGKMATSKDTGASISISAPGIVDEPCSPGVNNNFTLQANVSGNVSYVEFFRNGASVATDNSAPYELPQSFPTDGVYTYTAKAYSGSGFEVSNIYRVVVGLGTQEPYSSAHAVPGTFESGLYDKGGNGISFYDTNPNIYEANFRTDDEVDAASSPSQGTSIGWIAPGEWVEYSINATSGKYDISLNIASKSSEGGSSGSLSLDLDCIPVATINSTPLTGDWDTYQAVTATDINIPAGNHILRVSFNSGAFNLGRITLTRTGDIDDNGNTPPAAPTGLQVTNTTSSSISVSWNASTDADNNLSGYDVHLNGALVESITGTSYTFSGLSANTPYVIEVNAKDTENAVSGKVSVNGTTDQQTGSGILIPATIQAENYTAMSGIQLEGTSDDGGGQNVGWIDTGDWLEYEINAPTAGEYTINYRVASQSAGGTVEFFTNGVSQGTTSFSATGDWQIWATVSTTVNLSEGDQTVRLTANSSGWNINWVEFENGGCTPTAITPHLTVNGGSWQQTATATLDAGGSITFGPQAASGGSWSWIGPNSFAATTREVSINNIQINQAGEYTATYTNTEGCESTQSFTVIVNDVSTGVPIPSKIQAEDYTAMNGIQLEATSDTDRGQNVGWIDSGDWLEYEVNAPQAGEYAVNYRVASQSTGGTIEFFTNGVSQGQTTFAATGDWQNWTTASTTVTLPAGDQTIRLVANSSGWNINWIEFTSSGTPPDSDGCSVAVNTDFSVTISDDASNPSMTFVPERSGVGAPTCILYYGTSPDGTYPGYVVSANSPYQINASAGQTIYFYYTYSLPEGGENNTLNTKKSFVTGQCSSGSGVRMGSEQTSINEKDVTFTNLILFPNPANDKLTIAGLPEELTEVKVFDATGRVQLVKKSQKGQKVSFDIRHLVNGLHFVRILTKNGVVTKSFIKR